MIKKILFLLLILACFFPKNTLAANTDYVISDFQSLIEVNPDTSLTITETIQADFKIPKHGIFRDIPENYQNSFEKINARIKIISVSHPYTISNQNDFLRIKIGDPDKTITGIQNYVIKYQVKNVLRRYQDHDEVYWNVTGHNWDTDILKAAVVVNSPNAPITKILCYSGPFGSQESQCESNFSQNQATFKSLIPLGVNNDFTLVIALDKNNQLTFPNPILSNWFYLISLLPGILLFFFWYRKGRDLMFLQGNIYYRPTNQQTTSVPLFHHEALPMVYSPIKDLTPSQIGTIFDEKVDIQDIVAEIIELARLKFLEIRKTQVQGLFHKKTEYLFINKKLNPSKLKDYQKEILNGLFENKDEVKLSDLKYKFYKHLPTIQNKLYDNMKTEKLFAGNPNTTRLVWLIIAFLASGLSLFLLVILEATVFAFIICVLSIIIAFILGYSMPRRTARGHALKTQINGLRWYINIGKWRQEIAEKNLFIEQILPLAISLGVVDKLAKDMAVLNIEPPSYMNGFTTAAFAHDLSRFSSTAGSTLASGPKSSGGSWSGGSGFGGGGSSGGGFGGGGGGSW